MPLSVELETFAPKEVFSDKKCRLAIYEMMKTKTGPKIMYEFGKTIQGWKKRPNFSQRSHNYLHEIAVQVWATGKNKDIYAYVNNGTRKHTIGMRPWAKRSRSHGHILRFESGYSASTQPGVIGSRSNYRFGDYVTAIVVNHPGSEAREFDKAIADEISPEFVADMQDAINSVK